MKSEKLFESKKVSNGEYVLKKLLEEKHLSASSIIGYDKHSDSGYSKHSDDWEKGR